MFCSGLPYAWSHVYNNMVFVHQTMNLNCLLSYEIFNVRVFQTIKPSFSLNFNSLYPEHGLSDGIIDFFVR